MIIGSCTSAQGVSHKNSNFQVLLKKKKKKSPNKESTSPHGNNPRTGIKLFLYTGPAVQSPQSPSLFVMLNGQPPSFTCATACLNLKEQGRQREEHDKRKGGMNCELFKGIYAFKKFILRVHMPRLKIVQAARKIEDPACHS